MKTLKHINQQLLLFFLRKNLTQSEAVTFCETYTQREVQKTAHLWKAILKRCGTTFTVNPFQEKFTIRKSDPDKAFPLKQDLAEVSIWKDGSEENYALFIKFSKSGTEKWASMTRLNKVRDIAILFNGSVLAAPRLQKEIKNGECMISGKFTESEIKQLKRVF